MDFLIFVLQQNKKDLKLDDTTFFFHALILQQIWNTQLIIYDGDKCKNSNIYFSYNEVNCSEFVAIKIYFLLCRRYRFLSPIFQIEFKKKITRSKVTLFPKPALSWLLCVIFNEKNYRRKSKFGILNLHPTWMLVECFKKYQTFSLHTGTQKRIFKYIMVYDGKKFHAQHILTASAGWTGIIVFIKSHLVNQWFKTKKCEFIYLKWIPLQI